MPTVIENLLTRKAAIAEELATSPDVLKMNHSAAGRTFNYDDHVRRLYEELKAIDQQIGSAEGPFECPVTGLT